MADRDLIIGISLDPPISGYGGFDEWFIESLSNEERDKFRDDLGKLVEKYKGYYSGSG